LQKTRLENADTEEGENQKKEKIIPKVYQQVFACI
jgi:hypothetical protein